MPESFGKFLVVAGAAVVGLNLVSSFNSTYGMMLAVLILVGISVMHPEFYTELSSILKNITSKVA